MKYFFQAFLFFVSLQMGFSQNSKSWNSYFSYNEIKDVSEATDRVFAASENALFSKNDLTNEIKTTNTIDGLPGQTISALYHSETFNRTMIGYENGLLMIINENDGTIKTVVDIINKQINPTIKKINHFSENNGIVYVSCDFGIVQYNLATLQFGDTYFIGDNGAEIKVTQTTIFDGFIYASTPSSGIRRANILSDNLIDFNEWVSIASGSWDNVEAFGTELLAINTIGSLHRFNGATFQPFLSLPQASIDMRHAKGFLSVTTRDIVYIYNQQLAQIAQINVNQITETDVQFTCATIISNKIYMGTANDGMIVTSLSNPSSFEFIVPDGPLKNAIFAIHAKSENIWAVFGGYEYRYNPYIYDDFGGPAEYGISKFSQNKWLNIPYEKVLGAKALSSIEVNPNNPNEVYIGSFFSGLLKLVDDVPTILYDDTNTGQNGPESLSPTTRDIRINYPTFDRLGNIWYTNSLTDFGIRVFTASGQWQKFSVEDVIQPVRVNFARTVIDKNSTKWIASRNGVVAFNENGNVLKIINSDNSEGNFPNPDVRALAIDNRNQLWIGTDSGLRVLSSIDRFNSDQALIPNPIIIIEEDVPQELFFQQFITDIVVDGANNKWIGTAESGVFQVSPNGQQVLQRFTITNSPLPSNSINDIDINPITGEVFFATTKGMVSFKGFSTQGSENLQNVKVYPNPVRPNYFGTVKITGLLDKARIKITDIEGNLVHEAVSEGGTIEWDTTAFGRYKVASGVYMIFISAQDGIETKVKKVMIVR